MNSAYECLVVRHDLRLVFLAAGICVLSSWAAIGLVNHVTKSRRWTRAIWLSVTGIVSGIGIWATHFVAMLAFRPGLPTGYDIGLTLLSLLAAVVLTGIGFTVAAEQRRFFRQALGGSMVGAGIAAMHYLGMAAFETQGTLAWNPTLVVVSVLVGLAFGSVALPMGLRSARFVDRALGTLLLTLAICGHHFTAMVAAAIVPDPRVEVSVSSLPTDWLAVAVAAASVLVLIFALVALTLDARERYRSELEADRMRGLADAAVEGMVVCDGETIVALNRSLESLIGASADTYIGENVSRLFPEAAVMRRLWSETHQAVEADLATATGQPIPVEAILRVIDYRGRAHNAVAIRDLRDRKKAEEHIHYLAHHDALTGLPNRTTFNDRLDREIEVSRSNGRMLGVLCIDLDRFKEVNDLFGHAAGDAVLKKFARCASRVLKPQQMIARLGGDEFAIIAPQLESPVEAGRIAETLLEALRSENERSPTASFVSASIGVALFPADAEDRRQLLTHGDTALYRAKADGRGVYRFFEASMGAQVRERRTLEHDLRVAVAQNQFRLVFQPLADVRTGEITGFEALIRWNHPERGNIPPDLFIPIAEETGTILQIGDWVLKTACAEAARWPDPLRVAVNISAVQLHSQRLGQLVHETLFNTGLPAGRLELEITETALVRDLDRALLTLRHLKSLGVRLVMDDFGTGYSSLSNLRAFPFDKVKIDKSFVRGVDINADSAAIVRAVLGLGRGLRIPMVAEGVETQTELDFLVDEACAEVQGYLIGRPDSIGTFLAEATARPAAARDGEPASVLKRATG